MVQRREKARDPHDPSCRIEEEGNPSVTVTSKGRKRSAEKGNLVMRGGENCFLQGMETGAGKQQRGQIK